MKMKKQYNPHHIRERVSKFFVLLMFATPLGNFYKEKLTQKNELKSDDIDDYLRKNRIPKHWQETIKDTILKGELNLPLHEGISLTIGDYQIRQNGFDIKSIKKLKDKTLSINITSDVSKTQLIEFINENKEMIKNLQILLDLPEVKYTHVGNLEEGFYFYILRDIHHLSYDEIVKKLREDPKYKRESVNDLKNRVKNTYKDYQKQLDFKAKL